MTGAGGGHFEKDCGGAGPGKRVRAWRLGVQARRDWGAGAPGLAQGREGSPGGGRWVGLADFWGEFSPMSRFQAAASCPDRWGGRRGARWVTQPSTLETAFTQLCC